MPTPYFFGVLIANRKTKEFIEVHGDVECEDHRQAKCAAVLFGVVAVKRDQSNNLFVVGTTVSEARLTAVTNNV